MTLSDSRVAEAADILIERTGLRLSKQSAESFQAVLRAAMARAREHDLTRYVARLRTDERCLDALISEAVVGETYFFRDPALFDVIRDRIVPQILQERSAEGPMVIWSAGCASGEEPYSLAILMDQLDLCDRTHIVATDLSRTAIETAKRGVYREWSFRGSSEPWRERWFHANGTRWVISPRLRARVQFAVQSLTQPASSPIPPSGADLIVCRNVLIYFDAETVARVVRNLVGALAPTGWLVTAPSDPFPPTDLGLERVMTPAGIVYRRTAIPTAPLVMQTAPRAAPVRVSDEGRLRPAPSALQPTPLPQVEAAASRIRLMMERGACAEASAEAEAATLADPLDPELQVLRALLCLDLGRIADAVIAARRATFLDGSLVIAHLLLGRALRLSGRSENARRSLERCVALVASRSADEVVPFADGRSTSRLGSSLLAELNLLERARELAHS
jgi:chemotaxis protein methyltransferase CheR